MWAVAVTVAVPVAIPAAVAVTVVMAVPVAMLVAVAVAVAMAVAWQCHWPGPCPHGPFLWGFPCPWPCMWLWRAVGVAVVVHARGSASPDWHSPCARIPIRICPQEKSRGVRRITAAGADRQTDQQTAGCRGSLCQIVAFIEMCTGTLPIQGYNLLKNESVPDQLIKIKDELKIGAEWGVSSLVSPRKSMTIFFPHATSKIIRCWAAPVVFRL